MKKLLLAAMLLMFSSQLFAGDVITVRQENLNGFTPITGVIFGAASSGDSIFVLDSAVVGGFTGDSLIGMVIELTSDSCKGQVRYITGPGPTPWSSGTDARDTLCIHKDWVTNPDSGITFEIYYDYSIRKNTPLAKNLTGWNITKGTGDTLYSDHFKIPNSVEAFTLVCQAETLSVDQSKVCSTDVKVWLQVSHDDSNWYVPTGHSSIFANITDYVFHADDVTLLPGTKYARIAATGNAGNNALHGSVWLRQWVMMDK